MLVHNLRPHHRTIDLGKDRTIRLLPGTNEVDADLWKLATEIKTTIRKRQANGSTRKIEASLIDVLVKAGDLTYEDTTLDTMNAAQAAKTVSTTYDVQLLEAWLASEKRSPIRSVIERQIELLREERKPDPKE